MLKPCKQNKVVRVKRLVTGTPYFGRHLYRGKRYLKPVPIKVRPNVVGIVEDISVPFWPSGIGYILLMDEQGNVIKNQEAEC